MSAPQLRNLLAILLVCWASVAQAQTTRVSDSFTNSSTDEALSAQTNHTTEVGASPFWAELTDTAGTLQFNADNIDVLQVSGSSASNRIIWVATPNSAFGSADYDVSLKYVSLVAGQTDGDDYCVFGRLADTTHGYGACVSGATAPQTITIIEFDGSDTGVTPLASSTSITVTVNDIIRLSMRGDTIKMFGGASGTTQLLCVVDATQTAAGQPGVGMGNFITATADVNTTWFGDDFLVVDQTSQGGDDNCVASSAPRGTLLGILP